MRQQLIALVLGEVSRELRGDLFPPAPGRARPAYTAKAVPSQVIVGQESVTFEDREVKFHLRGFAPDVLLIEARTDVDDIFHRDVFDLEEKIYRDAYAVLEEYGGSREVSEEYSVFAVSEYEGPPEQFLTTWSCSSWRISSFCGTVSSTAGSTSVSRAWPTSSA